MLTKRLSSPIIAPRVTLDMGDEVAIERDIAAIFDALFPNAVDGTWRFNGFFVPVDRWELFKAEQQGKFTQVASDLYTNHFATARALVACLQLDWGDISFQDARSAELTELVCIDGARWEIRMPANALQQLATRLLAERLSNATRNDTMNVDISRHFARVSNTSGDLPAVLCLLTLP